MLAQAQEAFVDAFRLTNGVGLAVAAAAGALVWATRRSTGGGATGGGRTRRSAIEPRVRDRRGRAGPRARVSDAARRRQTASRARRRRTGPSHRALRGSVLAATVDLLREVGYGSLTIEAVAARSGVAKSTIYRQWSGKAQIVADAFLRAHGLAAGPPPPGPVRDRVVAILRATIEDIGTTDRLACIMPALIDAAERSEEIAEMTRRVAEEKNGRLRIVLDEAVASGELQADIDTTLLADALVGPILMCRLFHRPPVTADDVPALVDQILPACDAGRRA